MRFLHCLMQKIKKFFKIFVLPPPSYTTLSVGGVGITQVSITLISLISVGFSDLRRPSFPTWQSYFYNL